jgi:hypothetical protein
MKFYEFNNYQYYALIGAETEDEAIECYKEQVADIDDDPDDVEPQVPDELPQEEAWEKFKDAKDLDHGRDNPKTIEEFTKEFSGPDACIILIDSELI